MRLIDADALKRNRIGYSVQIDKYTGKWPCVLLHEIGEAPTIDAVVVVRCKDCRWYNNRMCYHPRFDFVCEVPPTMLDFDYCRYGEQKDEKMHL